MRILVTGSTGFVGSFLVNQLLGNGYYVSTVARSSIDVYGEHHKNFVLPSISEHTDWKGILEDVDVVIHLAGLAHILNDSKASMESEFMAVNYRSTVNLAAQAEKFGVKRFIFMSSIAVYGLDHSDDDINEDSPTSPITPYGRSKYAAEQSLNKLGAESSMEIVIVRPPLVYDRGAPGNFGLLLNLVKKRVPMPFQRIRNRRSFIARSNLVSFILACLHDRMAGNQTFVVSDDQDLSTPELIRLLSVGMNSKPLLVPVPLTLLKVGAALVGRRRMYLQLCGSLRLDISKAKSLLNWSPVETAESAVTKAAKPLDKVS